MTAAEIFSDYEVSKRCLWSYDTLSNQLFNNLNKLF